MAGQKIRIKLKAYDHNLIDKWRAEGMHLDFINYDAVETFKDFGGIRLEDDILITPDGSRFLGEKRIPITVEEVEDIMNE